MPLRAFIGDRGLYPWEREAMDIAARALRARDTLDMVRAYSLAQPVDKKGERKRRNEMQALINEHNVPLFGSADPTPKRNLWDMLKRAREKGNIKEVQEKLGGK